MNTQILGDKPKRNRIPYGADIHNKRYAERPDVKPEGNQAITPKQELETSEGIIQPTNIPTPASINPKEYIQLPQTNIVIARIEPDWTKGFNYEDTHRKLLEQGHFMPTPVIFMQYFNQVINAYNSKNQLYDATGNSLSKEEIEAIYRHLTSDHINGGAWSWLNATFLRKSKKQLNLETIIGINQNGDLIKVQNPLTQTLEEECYIDFTNLNSQGLPNKNAEHSNQDYEQGSNLYFYPPTEDTVAWFNANSDRANLVCDVNPGNRNDFSLFSLGVFASLRSKRSTSQNSGGSK